MRKFVGALLLLLLGAIVMVALLELLFQALPVTKGRIRVRDESSWPLHNYMPNTRYTYSFGWDMRQPQHGWVNSTGQLAPFDFERGQVEVAVIGDSYVESAMNRYEDSLPAQLAGGLGRPANAVIGLAAGGLSISDYLALTAQAQAALSPKALVFVMIDGDISESLLPRQGWHHLVERPDGRIDNHFIHQRNSGDEGLLSGLLSDSSLYEYMRRHLGFSPATVWSHWWARWKAPLGAVAPTPTPTGVASARQRVAVDHFLSELMQHTGLPAACIAFVLDSDRNQLYLGKPSATLDSTESRSRLASHAQALGMAVVDLKPIFDEHYRRHGKRFDFSPTDRHWNPLGHRLAADAARSALARCEVLNLDTRRPTPTSAQPPKAERR